MVNHAVGHLLVKTTAWFKNYTLHRLTCIYTLKKVKKVKEADLYSAFIEVPYTQGA